MLSLLGGVYSTQLDINLKYSVIIFYCNVQSNDVKNIELNNKSYDLLHFYFQIKIVSKSILFVIYLKNYNFFFN